MRHCLIERTESEDIRKEPNPLNSEELEAWFKAVGKELNRKTKLVKNQKDEVIDEPEGVKEEIHTHWQKVFKKNEKQNADRAEGADSSN